MDEAPVQWVERVAARRVGNNEYHVVVQRFGLAADVARASSVPYEESLLRGPISAYEAQELVKVENARRSKLGTLETTP